MLKDMVNTNRIESTERVSTVLPAWDNEAGGDNEDAITYLLTDIMHYCETHGISFIDALSIADVYFIDENR